MGAEIKDPKGAGGQAEYNISEPKQTKPNLKWLKSLNHQSKALNP